MNKSFILFLLIFTFSLHALEEQDDSLLDDSSATLNNEETDQVSEQEADSPFKEKDYRYVVASQKKSSPLMMLPSFREKEGKEDPIEKSLSTADFSVKQRRDAEFQSFSAKVSRSSNPVAIAEKRNTIPPQATSASRSSALFKTLIYCPECKKWHTAPNISNKPIPQILFFKNLQTGYWHPIHREDERARRSLFQEALHRLSPLSSSQALTKKRNFELVTDDNDEEVLHHISPKTGMLEKSSFQDPIDALPALSHSIVILLQMHSMIPTWISHHLLVQALGQEEKTLLSTSSPEEAEKIPLLSKGTPNSYFSTEN